ncbi:hypothetical protein L873DRAFT_1179088 [Choiromyces venosus 120613-1]|uniref:Uncharacterized protein n=1 Tax=Choiromyces venosus 120613-1 TaxID=1336337 RepID=A0A3N4K2U4_9PEZI|nr:hypothetical protein L873DRAFT_1179088 [Choiromyces venosus 120613-1]
MFDNIRKTLPTNNSQFTIRNFLEKGQRIQTNYQELIHDPWRNRQECHNTRRKRKKKREHQNVRSASLAPAHLTATILSNPRSAIHYQTQDLHSHHSLTHSHSAIPDYTRTKFLSAPPPRILKHHITPDQKIKK